jgi:thiol-disulfide isomerase/thioredoxin
MMNNKLFPRELHTPLRLFMVGLIMLIMLTVQPGSAAIFSLDEKEIPGDQLINSMNNATNVSATPFPIQFFYNTHCGSCQAAIQYMDKFATNHTDIRVDHHDLFNNTESFALYEDYKKQFNRTDIHYPIIFMGNVGIMGSEDITTYTEPLTLWYQTNSKKDPLTGLVSWVTSFTKENK